ncbi:hypothetical protein AAVH_16501 [Aphelenchoides avenae]|nr:hypothetical protein AAVH_16501 [Aphelenchus avenae]
MWSSKEFGEDDDEFLSPEYNAQTEELIRQMENARCEMTPVSTLDRTRAQTSDEWSDLRSSLDSGSVQTATCSAVPTRMPVPAASDILAAISEQVDDEWTRSNEDMTRDDEWDANANRLLGAGSDAFGLAMNIVPSAGTSMDGFGSSQDEPTDSRRYTITGECTGLGPPHVLTQKNLRKKVSNPVYVSNDWTSATTIVPTVFQRVPPDATYSFAKVNPQEPIEVRVVLPESTRVYAVRVERLQSTFVSFEAEFTSFYYDHVPECLRLEEEEIIPGLACVHFFRDIGPRRAVIVAVDSSRQFHVRQVDYATMLVLATPDELYPLEQRFLNEPISAYHVTRENAPMDDTGPLPVNCICTMTIHKAEPETFFVDLVPRVQPSRKSGRTSFGLTRTGYLRQPVCAGLSEAQLPPTEDSQHGGHKEAATDDPFDEGTWTVLASQKHAEPRVTGIARKFSSWPDHRSVPAFTPVRSGHRRFRQGPALVQSGDVLNADQSGEESKNGPSLEERPEHSQQSPALPCISVKQQWEKKWRPYQAASDRNC